MTVPNRRHDDPDDVDYRDTRNGFSYEFPLNLGRISGRGKVAVTALVVVGGMIATFALVWINYRGFQDVQDLLRESNSGHVEMARAFRELGCIVSLRQEERTSLRLNGNWDAYCPGMGMR